MSEQLEWRRLANKVCVIAGAANAIGSAIAERLQREGATTVGIDRQAHSVGMISMEAGLDQESAVAQTYAHIHDQLGRIDVLVNNQGLTDPEDHSVLDMTTETWDRVLRANLTTTFLCCKHGIPYLLLNQSAGGSVVNMASFAGVMGAATAQMAYSAAKAGVIQLSRDLGTHLARRGVRVNAVVLGPIDTPQLRAVFENHPEELPKRLIHAPMGRFGALEEVAGAVAYLASEDAGFVTASAFPLDGGITTAFTVAS